MGASDSPVAPAMNSAIFLMMAVIGSVLASIAAFMIYLAVRARSHRVQDAGFSGMPILPGKEDQHA